MLKAIMWDLDGTLLPMPSQEEFVKYYFALLTKVKPYDPQRVIAAVWSGTAKMVANDGKQTNYEVFWENFKEQLGDLLKEDVKDIEEAYNHFYAHEFAAAKVTTYDNPLAKEVIAYLHDHDLKVILATNPLFPACAVETRLRWIALSSEDFDFITTYENMAFCKPNPEYYRDILSRNDLKADEVIMIGNDVKEDILATDQCGIKNILITDTMIGDKALVKGEIMSFKEVMAYFRKLFD